MDTDPTFFGNLDAKFWLSMVIIFLLLFLSGFFSASETCLTAFRRTKMHQMATQGVKNAKIALDLKSDGERMIGSVLLGNNLINILSTSIATSAFITAFGDSGVAWATLIMTILILIFGEVIPKTYAIIEPEKAALLVARPISIVVWVFSPIVSSVRRFARVIFKLFGVNIDPDVNIMHAEEEIKGAIDMHHSEGAVVKDDRDMLLAALELKAREVSEVMKHRKNIFMIDINSGSEAILDACLNSQYTRIPLYQDDPDNIVGIIHAKDLLRAVNKLVRREGKNFKDISELDIISIAMEPWFIPNTTSLSDQMQEFLKRRTHFALVVDEYGALQGLITLEDIIEEIVGDISDEHDVEVQGLSRLPDGSWLVDGATTIRDLNRACELNLPDDEATTIAGLVIHQAQVIPTEGQIFIFLDFRFEVVRRVRNQITQIRMRPVRH
jgi:Mg2+/Co2+ transporter CorB